MWNLDTVQCLADLVASLMCRYRQDSLTANIVGLNNVAQLHFSCIEAECDLSTITRNIVFTWMAEHTALYFQLHPSIQEEG